MTENALEKAGAPGAAFAPHFFLLQLLQPLDGVEESAVRAAAGGVKPLRAVSFERPKMTRVSPL